MNSGGAGNDRVCGRKVSAENGSLEKIAGVLDLISGIGQLDRFEVFKRINFRVEDDGGIHV